MLGVDELVVFVQTSDNRRTLSKGPDHTTIKGIEQVTSADIYEMTTLCSVSADETE